MNLIIRARRKRASPARLPARSRILYSRFVVLEIVPRAVRLVPYPSFPLPLRASRGSHIITTPMLVLAPRARELLSRAK